MYKVLLVEDEILVRLGLKNSLPWQKYQMEVAADAEDGLTAFEKFQTVHPDLVVTDIRMNGMDGISLIRRIRQLDERCALLVISCLDDFETLREIMKYNVIGYILKARTSLDEMEELLEKAQQYLEKSGGPRQPDPQETPPEALLLTYIAGSGPFPSQWRELGYSPPEDFTSMALFRIDAPGQKSLSSLGLSFIQSIIGENLPESHILQLDSSSILAVSRENLTYTDSRLCRIVQMVQSFFDAPISLATRKLLSGLFSLREEVQALREEGEAPMEQSIRKAIDYLYSHYSQDISLNDVAAFVGLSPNYLSALFKKAVGMTYVTYLNNIRIERAKFLLQNTGDYMYAVSEQAGFHSFEHFSQVFKQKTGMNPGEWRRQHGR